MVAGATITVGPSVVPRYSPIGRATAIDWDRAKDAAVVGAATIVTGPLGGAAAAYYLGDENSYENYTGEDALRIHIYEGNLQMKSSYEQILSSLENTVSFVENTLLPKGMAAIVEELNDDNSKEAAEEAMSKAIDEHCAGIQKDIIQNCESNLEQYSHYVDQLDSHDEADPRDVLWGDQYSSSGGSVGDVHNPSQVFGWDDAEVELADGSTYEMEVPRFSRRSSNLQLKMCPEFVVQNSDLDDYEQGVFGHFEINEDGETATDDDEITDDHGTLEMERYDEVLDELSAARGSTYGELSSFIDDVYSNYDPGDVDLGDVVDPTTAYLEFSNDIDDESYAGAMASNMLGIPRTNEPMEIVLEDDEVSVEGSIYSQEAPDGGFDVGQTYDPDALENAVMMRFTEIIEEGQGETAFREIDQPFTIVEATNSDGEAVGTVDTESEVEYDPADIESIQEQLEQVREQQISMQEEAQDDDSSWLPSLPGLGTGASAIVYVLLGLTGFGLFVLFVLVAIAMITR